MIAADSKFKNKNKLYGWIVKNKMTVSGFCLTVGMSRTALYGIFNDKHSPDIVTIARIVFATNGEVCVSDLISGETKQKMEDLLFNTSFHILKDSTKFKIAMSMLK